MLFTELSRGTVQKVSAWLLCFALLTTTSCQPQIYASSDSTDGKYRCEVTRSRPFLSGLFGDGEFRYYHFELVERKTHQRLAGNGFTYGDGKLQLEKDQIEFKWDGNQLTVLDQGVAPARPIAFADFAGPEQHWKPAL